METAYQGILREHTNLSVTALRIFDVFAVTTGALVSHAWAEGGKPMSGDELLEVAFVVLLGHLLFRQIQLYRAWRSGPLIAELGLIIQAWLGILVAIVLIVTATDITDLRGLTRGGVWVAIGLGLMILGRVARRTCQSRCKRPQHRRRVILIGLSQTTISIEAQLRQSSWGGLEPVGYFDDRAEPRFVAQTTLPYLGGTNDLAAFMEREPVDQVWLVYPLRAEPRVNAVLHALRHVSVDIRYAMDVSSFNIIHHGVSEVAGVPMLNLSASPLDGANWLLKELEDRVAALLILLLISPLMLAIAIGVKLSSPGPVFYRQERVSWHNRRFHMLKFRSMPVNTESASGPVWSKPGEARATPFGAFLRRTSLDELPQFFNVLMGEMSIVGPRPERPHFVEQFKEQVPYYMKKHLVKAGITGWAQVNGLRGDTDLVRRIEYDLYYINHWSLSFDLWIVLMTLLRGFVHKNAY
jgi:putative colanic acid biosynthesis UDP-glucose lipid carrier transferase